MAVVATEATVRAATEDGMLVRVARRAVPLVNSLLSCEYFPRDAFYLLPASHEALAYEYL